jgi:hypothetical protein
VVSVDAKIAPHLWYAEKAVEAAEFYVSVFPDSLALPLSPSPGHRLTPMATLSPSGRGWAACKGNLPRLKGIS